MIGDSTLSGVEQALEKVASQAPYLKHIKDVVAFLQVLSLVCDFVCSLCFLVHNVCNVRIVIALVAIYFYVRGISPYPFLQQHPRSGVSISTRTHRMRRYKDCFSGSEAVDWFATFLRLTRPEVRSKFLMVLPFVSCLVHRQR